MIAVDLDFSWDEQNSKRGDAFCRGEPTMEDTVGLGYT